MTLTKEEASFKVTLALAKREWRVTTQLSLLMLFEFMVFGTWFATMGLVLATHNMASIIGNAYLYSAVAAMISPLIFGAIGDSYIKPKRLFALTHLLGGVVMLAIPAAVNKGDTDLTLGLIFTYMLLFQPTLGIVNSIALRSLGESSSIFPLVRLFGPLGWVVGGVVVGMLGLSASTSIFYLTALWSIVCALYTVMLGDDQSSVQNGKFSLTEVLGFKALVLFKERNFTVLMVCALLTSISLGVYNAFGSPYLSALGITNVAGVMALGQTSEVLFIFAIPPVLARIGMKWALLLGMAMWGVRFFLFMGAPYYGQELAVFAVALHGICNDFFIVIAAMYIDRLAPKHLSVQAQSWLILMISGFGAAIGSTLAGNVFGKYIASAATPSAKLWEPMWIIPIVCAVITTIVWTTLFKYKTSSTATNR